jgi:hypothetical protein
VRIAIAGSKQRIEESNNGFPIHEVAALAIASSRRTTEIVALPPIATMPFLAA